MNSILHVILRVRTSLNCSTSFLSRSLWQTLRSVLLILAHFKSNFAFPHPSPQMKLCSSSTLPILYCSLFHCCVTLLKEKLPVEEELHISVPICMGRSIWPCLSICFWCKLVTEKLVGVICDIMLIVKCNIPVYKQMNGKHVTHYTYFGHEQ